jgi:hypothetical protein
MFIAMNRFRVVKGSEADFEQVWLSRDSHLDKVPGFVEFHLLKGPATLGWRDKFELHPPLALFLVEQTANSPDSSSHKGGRC